MSAASVLFAPGERPSKAGVQALAELGGDFAISFDPGPEGDWLELLASGLTFDVSGLSPGAAAPPPPTGYAYGLPPDLPAGLEAITLRPGPHLAAGGGMMPVVRCLAWLTARLAGLPAAEAVVWHPARCWSAPGSFRAAVTRWTEGGAFPAFSLAALARSADGGLYSEGLALFTGQELRLDRGVAGDPAAAAKIGLRLLHWLVEHGRVTGPEELAGPDGERLRLAPFAGGAMVRAWKD